MFPHDFPDPVEESSVFRAGRRLVMDEFHLRKRRQGAAGSQGSGCGRTWPPYRGASALMFTSFSNDSGSRHALPCFVLCFFKAVLSSHCLQERVQPPGGSSGGLSAPGSPGDSCPPCQSFALAGCSILITFLALFNLPGCDREALQSVLHTFSSPCILFSGSSSLRASKSSSTL